MPDMTKEQEKKLDTLLGKWEEYSRVLDHRGLTKTLADDFKLDRDILNSKDVDAIISEILAKRHLWDSYSRAAYPVEGYPIILWASIVAYYYGHFPKELNEDLEEVVKESFSLMRDINGEGVH